MKRDGKICGEIIFSLIIGTTKSDSYENFIIFMKSFTQNIVKIVVYDHMFNET